MNRTPKGPNLATNTLQIARFPLTALVDHPISAIESMAYDTGLASKPVCDVGCLACCTNSVRAADARGPVTVLSPRLLAAILNLASELAKAGTHIMSTDRFNLFSGSNELDHPSCVQLREILSSFFLGTHGRHLGAVSSDVVFHVSESPNFHSNLDAVIRKPLLWDNICVAIDEQIDFRRAERYSAYLQDLERVWTALRPVLSRHLAHAKPEREGGPRVILNMLVPDPSSSFQDKFRDIYPGGPARATTFGELARRYVTPFVGEMLDDESAVPREHRFTTGIVTLKGVRESKAFVAQNYYAPAGRAKLLVRFDDPAPREPLAIRTKILPVGDTAFRIAACFTTSAASEEEIPLHPSRTPAWFQALREFVIDVSDRISDPSEMQP